jgi:hypothetical protein
MDAMLFSPVSPRKQPDWALPEDFELGPGRPVTSRLVLTEPGWSLYTFDRRTGSAWFVDLPPEVDLSQAAFVYAEQKAQARRVLQVPFDALEELAEGIPPPEQVIFIFSIGRCGSTLMSRALNAVPGVWSLSEPDIYTRLASDSLFSTAPTGYTDEEVMRLVRAGTRLLFRPPPGREVRVLAVKFRSQASIQAEVFHRGMPEASCVFLYREALSWANSFYRMMRKYGIPPVLTGDRRTFCWGVVAPGQDPARIKDLLDLEAEEVPLEDALAPGWAFNMEDYLQHLQAGVPYLALRYDELTANPQGSLERLFRHCRLPLQAVEPALAAFEQDSQAGTWNARDVQVESLSEAQIAKLADLLARDPSGLKPDLRLPDVDREEGESQPERSHA